MEMSLEVKTISHCQDLNNMSKAQTLWQRSTNLMRLGVLLVHATRRCCYSDYYVRDGGKVRVCDA